MSLLATVAPENAEGDDEKTKQSDSKLHNSKFLVRYSIFIIA